MEQLRTADIRLQPRLTGSTVPLIPWQRRVWDAMMKRGTRLSGWTIYNASVRVLGPLNVPLLQKSIELVIQRHESLRTRIVEVDGTPRQHIDHACEYHLQTIELESSASGDVEMAEKRLIQDFANTDRDLSVGPLFEAKLVKMSSREHLLLVALDHMFSDAISIAILSRDIWTLYDQAVRGRSLSLPSLPLQFADYSVWQERTLGVWRANHEAYWIEHLSSAPSIQLPIDDSLRKTENRVMTVAEFPLNNVLSDELRDVARREGTLLSLAVLAIYVTVIARWCNRRDIVLAFVSHGRHGYRELENVIGLLPQQLFLRIQLHKKDTFRDLLKRVIVECHTAHQHEDHNRVRDLISECSADLCFNWISGSRAGPISDKSSSDDSSIEVQPLQIRRSPQNMDAWYDFTLAPRETPTGLLLGVVYRDCLFAPSTIDQFFRCFRLVAEEVAKCSVTSIAAISFA